MPRTNFCGVSERRVRTDISSDFRDMYDESFLPSSPLWTSKTKLGYRAHAVHCLPTRSSCLLSSILVNSSPVGWSSFQLDQRSHSSPNVQSCSGSGMLPSNPERRHCHPCLLSCQEAGTSRILGRRRRC